MSYVTRRARPRGSIARTHGFVRFAELAATGPHDSIGCTRLDPTRAARRVHRGWAAFHPRAQGTVLSCSSAGDRRTTKPIEVAPRGDLRHAQYCFDTNSASTG